MSYKNYTGFFNEVRNKTHNCIVIDTLKNLELI